jgi:hypothetical protein
MTAYVEGYPHFRHRGILHPQGPGDAELRNEGDDPAGFTAEASQNTELLRGFLGR